MFHHCGTEKLPRGLRKHWLLIVKNYYNQYIVILKAAFFILVKPVILTLYRYGFFLAEKMVFILDY